jgi:hypothetical protein
VAEVTDAETADADVAPEGDGDAPA